MNNLSQIITDRVYLGYWEEIKGIYRGFDKIEQQVSIFLSPIIDERIKNVQCSAQLLKQFKKQDIHKNEKLAIIRTDIPEKQYLVRRILE